MRTFLSATEYLSFFLTTSVAFGLVFELPLVRVVLTLVGAITAAGLRRARPYAIVAIVAFAAIITPTTDAITLLLRPAPAAVLRAVDRGRLGDRAVPSSSPPRLTRPVDGAARRRP